MYKGKRILALILARGGSKGIPRKNIKRLLGKPLIGWTIEQAKDSKYIDKLIVSTEDKEIAEVSKRYGAKAPFMRPKELARDTSPASEAILHAMDYFRSKKETYDILLILECTSPMRYKGDIDGVIAKLIDTKGAVSVIGVVEATNDHPLWSYRIANGYLARFITQAHRIKNFARQALEKAYLPYSIYAIWWNDYKRYKTFCPRRTVPYFLKREQKVDIDDAVDFYVAECILKKYLIERRKKDAAF